jgi:hypothetical protein
MTENNVRHSVTWCVVSHIVCRDPQLCVCVSSLVHPPLYSGKIAVYDLFFMYETNFYTESYTYYIEVGGREQRRDATAPLR